jgi:hypothetical protein
MEGLSEAVIVLGSILAAAAAEHMRRLGKMDKRLDKIDARLDRGAALMESLPCRHAEVSLTMCKPSSMPQTPSRVSSSPIPASDGSSKSL